MNCRQFSKIVNEYVNRGLDEGAVCEAQEHVRACPKCSELVRELQEASLMVRLLPREHAPAGFEHRLKERVAAAGTAGRASERPRGWWERLIGWSEKPPAFGRRPAFRPAWAFLIFVLIAVSAVVVNLSSRSDNDMDWGYIEACQEQHASFASANPLADESAVILRERARDLGDTL